MTEPTPPAPTSHASAEEAAVRPYTAVDHYNAAAAAITEIMEHRGDDTFTFGDATILLQIAYAHAQLGQLKFQLDEKLLSK